MHVSGESEAACSDEGEGEAVQTPQRVHTLMVNWYLLVVIN